jgi:5-carboxymethyl-2-hydroxymuconic-semialdehyde dehydrogenase
VTRPDGLPERILHFIGGKQVPSVSGATFDVARPGDEPGVRARCRGRGSRGRRPRSRAAHGARSPTGPWPGCCRARGPGCCTAIADAIEARDERIAELETFDTGLPITQARGQAARAAENFRFFADLIVALHEDAFRVPATASSTTSTQADRRRRADHAVEHAVHAGDLEARPSLASGCTVVLKPAEWTPLSASLLPEIMTEAGVPDGVFNIVHGIGEEAGAALVKHPDVPLISFTGETTTGQIIMRGAAATSRAVDGARRQVALRRVRRRRPRRGHRRRPVRGLLAERRALHRRLRILVERSIYDDFVARLAERARTSRSGPVRPGDRDRRARAPRALRTRHVLRRDRQAEGPGWWPAAGGPSTGSPPATTWRDRLRRRHAEMRIFQEEIFGPVVCVTPFEDEAEAVALANDTRSTASPRTSGPATCAAATGSRVAVEPG